MSKISGKRFGLYLGQHRGIAKHDFAPEQIEVLRQIADYVAQNGAVTKQKLAQTKGIDFLAQVIAIYSKDKIDTELEYYSKFLLQIKAA